MKFHLDTEFDEGFRKPISWLPTIGSFNKPKWRIILISIGIVCSDGRKYYAINSEFKRSECNEWVRNNVLTKLPPKYQLLEEAYPGVYRGVYQEIDDFPGASPMVVMNPLYKSIREIRDDIIKFMVPFSMNDEYSISDKSGNIDRYKKYIEAHPPVFAAYFADYDWVLFCTIFGTMMDLPTGFPMYCVDLKQELDRLACLYGQEHSLDKELSLQIIKEDRNYPVQDSDNEHNALEDAEWNMKLDSFISDYTARMQWM